MDTGQPPNPIHVDWHTIERICALRLLAPDPCCPDADCEARRLVMSWWKVQVGMQQTIRALAELIRQHDAADGANCLCSRVVPLKAGLAIALRNWRFLTAEWARIRNEVRAQNQARRQTEQTGLAN